MQAIVTKYCCPTNTRGARINAKCAAGSITVAYAHELDIEGNHVYAAQVLVQKLGWTPANGYALAMHTGCLHTGDYCHVLTN